MIDLETELWTIAIVVIFYGKIVIIGFNWGITESKRDFWYWIGGFLADKEKPVKWKIKILGQDILIFYAVAIAIRIIYYLVHD